MAQAELCYSAYITFHILMVIAPFNLVGYSGVFFCLIIFSLEALHFIKKPEDELFCPENC